MAVVGKTVQSVQVDSEGLVELALVGCVMAAYGQVFEDLICSPEAK